MNVLVLQFQGQRFKLSKPTLRKCVIIFQTVADKANIAIVEEFGGEGPEFGSQQQRGSGGVTIGKSEKMVM